MCQSKELAVVWRKELLLLLPVPPLLNPGLQDSQFLVLKYRLMHLPPGLLEGHHSLLEQLDGLDVELVGNPLPVPHCPQPQHHMEGPNPQDPRLVWTPQSMLRAYHKE